ncbi:YvrJ family protein [Peptoniphilus sp. KCTC 25270]|uniref:YvrJ family protein n=1 Tax=Peptoniphilus sp. KCTC 25270 TaxID=2897414 RepID=UPI001E38B6F7|nr:YvrJ family protein [Peptoniphilus sp. KCTC 25270]MCD1148040.1 YvrJ family protein [Peptoniphilus sp. KCTC 25270]
MDLDALLNLIANTGFPIVVASYFIVRMENKLGELCETIQELRVSIDKTLL